jgi:hypothetical protein
MMKNASPTALPVEHFGNPLTEAALHGITRALASVGRAFICLDPSFTIRHASHLLDQFPGEGVSRWSADAPWKSARQAWRLSTTHQEAAMLREEFLRPKPETGCNDSHPSGLSFYRAREKGD